MESSVIVSLISLFGSIVGTMGGIMVGSKLTQYRLDQLEKKLDTYDDLNRRVYALERHDEVMDTRFDAIEKLLNEKFDSIQEKQNDIRNDLNNMVGA